MQAQSAATAADGERAVASVRRKNATNGFGADPQATTMPWKDGRGGNVQNVVAAQYTRFGRRLTEVISGGATLAISSTSAVANPMFQVTRKGIGLQNRRALRRRGAWRFHAERFRPFLVDVAERFLGKGKVPICLVKIDCRADDQNRRCRGGRISSGSPAKCGD